MSQWNITQHTVHKASRDVGVASTSLEHLPTGMECEEEEHYKHKAENGEYDDAHDQVHCSEGPLHLVGTVGDGVGLVQQVAHSPANSQVMHLDRGRGE